MEVQWTQAKHKYGVDDLVMLTQLTEDELIANIRNRYNNDHIYTYIGPVLVSVNPFKGLPIYTDKFIETYCGKYPYELPPHVYALAEDAYRSMLSDESSQCIIISGESGAGKTEASKLIMQYIAAVSGNGKGVEHVKHVILESNPLLEAFGNAKTTRNNNSSRFGKYFQIYFNAAGDPEGGSITNYLLEKSRVVAQSKGERNFHIFYQLCAARNNPDLQHLRLGPPSQFNYLKNTDPTVFGMDDHSEFTATRHAMDVVGLSPSSQSSVFSTLAGILHLGNVVFDVDANGHAMPTSPGDVAMVASFLGVDPRELTECLVVRSISTGTGKSLDTVKTPLNVAQANATRDSLAKMLYERMFEDIVRAINKALNAPPTTSMSISVLDIYGFEIFDNNGFEQFCINYVNEKLQQIFIELTLRAEQDEYRAENIQWTPVEFFNNKTVCDLIEGSQPPGVFAHLDDACKQSHRSESSEIDKKFKTAMTKSLEHPHFSCGVDFFDVKHYAGQVRYKIDGFSDKNKDQTFDQLKICLKGSSIEYVQGLFPEDISDGSRKTPTTAGFKIRSQAAQLVNELMQCTPHYIRCIKPNETKCAGDWDAARVQHQVQYLGLLENVRVRRAGFAFRQKFDRFVRRYQCMLPPDLRSEAVRPNCNARELTTKLLQATKGLAREDWQLGASKVFIRRPETLFQFEEVREEFLQVSATKVQKFAKASIARSVVRARRYQGALLFHNKKERRRESLLRPFNSDYAHYLEDTVQQEFMKDYLMHPLLVKGGRRARAHDNYSGNEALLFSDVGVKRLFTNGKVMEWETGNLYLSNEAIYSVATIKRAKVESRFIRNRILLNDIQQVTLSHLQDNLVAISVKEGYGSDVVDPVSRADWMPDSATKECLQTKTKFRLTVRRSHCRNCGKIFIKDCVQNMIMLKGFAKPDKVCDQCYGTTLSEDQVLFVDHKLEFVFRLKEAFEAATGTSLPIDFNNSLSVRHVMPEAHSIMATFALDTNAEFPSHSFGQNMSLVVRVPPGLPASTLPTKFEARGGAAATSQPTTLAPANAKTAPARAHPTSADNRRSVRIKERLTLVQSHAVARVSVRMETVTSKQCRVIFDYQPHDDDGLALHVGDIVTITAKDESGWWEGEFNGKTGFFPANFVEEIAPGSNPDAGRSKSPSMGQNKVTTKEYCVVKFQFDPPGGDYLELQVGDVVEIVAKDDSGWWDGRKGGKQGFFPSNYVEPCPPPSSTMPPRSGSDAPAPKGGRIVGGEAMGFVGLKQALKEQGIEQAEIDRSTNKAQLIVLAAKYNISLA